MVGTNEEYTRYELVSFIVNVGFFCPKLHRPGVEHCNSIRHSIHGMSILEKVSKKRNLNYCLFPFSKSQPAQVRKLAHMTEL